jgi:hypothetical protein
MYAFLLLLGAVITAAGLGLVASSVSIQDHTFDATNVLPAMIAVIGGCILIGLSFVVRALQRVERALMARPMPRPARLGEIGSAALPTTQSSEEAARILFPTKPKAQSYLQPVPPAARPAPAAGKSPEALRDAVPLVVEETDVSLLPKAPVRLDEENGDVDHSVSGRPNGSVQVKTAPRFTVTARPARKPLQPQDSMFNNLWPMAPAAAPAPKADLAPAVKVQVAPALAGGSEPTPKAPPAEVRQDGPAPVSVLKSGVVEGMAYTLYSDGSIEAQLPGGMVRFGSITELRDHIEKNG